MSARIGGRKHCSSDRALTSGDVAGSTPIMMENKDPLDAPVQLAAAMFTVDEKKPGKPWNISSGFVS